MSIIWREIFILMSVVGFIMTLSDAVNVALNKSAYQTGAWDGMTADRAVDGRTDDSQSESNDYYKDVCAHPDTGNPNVPAVWWVDLEDTYSINSVTIWNTYDAGGYQRMANFKITTQLNGYSEKQCGYIWFMEVPRGDNVTFTCASDTYANFVYVRKLSQRYNHQITICEVEVDGELVVTTPASLIHTTGRPTVPILQNIAYNKPTNQTGTHNNNAAWSSDKAVDGLFSHQDYDGGKTYCARPDNPNNNKVAEWWVDLQGMYLVERIIVYNTYFKDGAVRLTRFTLGVIHPVKPEMICSGEYTDTIPPGGSATSVCDAGTIGRYVHFTRTGDPTKHRVTLCEVIVLGEELDIKNYTDQAVQTSSTDESINVDFEQIPVSYSLIHYYDYRVYYWRTGQSNKEFVDVDQQSSPTTINVTIRDLNPNTEYNIEMKPYRELDGEKTYGQSYPQQTVKTKCAAPDIPQNVKVKVVNMTSFETIHVTYELPTTIHCNEIIDVIAKYQLQTSSTWMSTAAGTVGDPITLSVTKPGTYQVQLYIRNDAGKESSSKVIGVAIQNPESSSTGSSDQDMLLIIIPVIGAIILITVVVVLVILLRRRKQHKTRAQSSPEAPNVEQPNLEPAVKPEKPLKPTEQVTVTREPYVMLPTPDDTTPPALPPVQPSPTSTRSAVSLEENQYMNSLIPLAELEAYVAARVRDPKIYDDEFRTLPKPRNSLCRNAQTDDNKAKNRFLNIYPYDTTRVKLDDDEDSESDYINANYISGYRGKPKVYIATQGPRPNTLDDFWKMIWQENVNRIVMVANISENRKNRVTPYWPNRLGESQSFSNFTVTFEAVEISSEYAVRTISLQHGQNDSRIIRQFHFTCWKDKGRPDYGPPSLLAFHRKVKSFEESSTGPLVVHCSAGVGRTGTFIAMDILLQQMAQENQVDIYGCVYKLRQERMTMVQVRDQYVFLHDAMIEQKNVGMTFYSCNNLSQTLASLCETKERETSTIDNQFEMLRRNISMQDSNDKSGIAKVNRNKNRDMKVIPDERCRIQLSTPYNKGNDYINAISAHSFKKHEFYIVTQMPLPSTIVDFWRLVYDQNCHTIIMLNEIDPQDATMEEYWPDEPNKPTQYGPLKVELLNQNQTDNIITRDFSLEKGSVQARKSSRPVGSEIRQFQLLGWPDNAVLPEKREDLLELLDLALQRYQSKGRTDKAGEVIVHCLNGRGACGVFCGVSFTLDRMKVEQEVDAFMAARRVSANRPEFFQSVEEYKALFDMAVTRIEKYSTYVNR